MKRFQLILNGKRITATNFAKLHNFVKELRNAR